MTISAKVICDSTNGHHRLTTLVCRYQRFFHQEVLTHRDKSRNSGSSRAIPVETLINRIKEDTAMPLFWGLNQPGMQAKEEANPAQKQEGINAWIRARDKAIESAMELHNLGFHKQIVNRILEPFMHIELVLSGTDWGNFFELRCHPDAQPEFQALASAIRSAMDKSAPFHLFENDWHLPFITNAEKDEIATETLKKISAARCARVSYKLHDGSSSTVEKDLKLCDRLMGARPFHASPFEHVARPCPFGERHRNFNGWIQYRVDLERQLSAP